MLWMVLTIIPFQNYSQGVIMDDDKYDLYRERFRNRFLIGIGAESGMSIPAMSWDTVSGIVRWSDCTIDHGHYLGMLGSEYKILSKLGEDTDETIRELFYALYAFNRLDYYAEVYFGGPPSLNGFFVRDDVSEDSLNMQEVLEQLNEGLPFPKIDSLASDYMEDEPRLKEESLDQAIMLLTGLGIIIKCVPPEVIYYEDDEAMAFQDFEVSIQKEAKNIVNRIVNYMKEGDSTVVELDINDPNLFGIQGLNWDFIIKNPVTYEEVFRGANAFFLSPGFTGTKYWLTGNESPTTDTSLQQTSLDVFLSLENIILPSQQDIKVMNLDAMSNVWPEGVQQDTAFTDYNARILGPRAQMQYYEWVPMLHQVVFQSLNYLMSAVHPDTMFYNDPRGFYEYLLDLAPEEGPYNYNDSIYPNWEWSTTSRTIHPERRGEQNTFFTGNYNGLDYMFLRNLYVINYTLPVTIPEHAVCRALIYPNPNAGSFHVEINNYKKFYQVEIISMHGQVLLQKICHSGDCQVSPGRVSPGLYLVRIRTDLNQILNQKIIIR